MATERDTATWLHGSITMMELVECSGLSEAEVRALVDTGAIPLADPAAVEWTFAAECGVRLRAARRLQRDFELEQEAIGLLFAFLERIDRLEAELRDARAQLQFPRR